VTGATTQDSPSARLRLLERFGLGALALCAGLLILTSAVDAYRTSMTFLQLVRAWPGQLVAALMVGVACGVVPLTPLGDNLRIRVGALVVLLSSVLWLAVPVGITGLYMLVMSGFD
jgi:hypothetical protein